MYTWPDQADVAQTLEYYFLERLASSRHLASDLCEVGGFTKVEVIKGLQACGGPPPPVDLSYIQR